MARVCMFLGSVEDEEQDKNGEGLYVLGESVEDE